MTLTETAITRLLEIAGQMLPGTAANVMIVEGNIARVAGARGYERWGEVSAAFIATYTVDLATSELRRCALESGQAVFIPDVRDWPGWIDTPEAISWLRAYAVIPIRTNGQVTGFLNVSGDKPRAFGKEQVEQLKDWAGEICA